MKLAWMYFAGAGVKLHVGATHRDTLFTILSVSERVREREGDFATSMKNVCIIIAHIHPMGNEEEKRRKGEREGGGE